MQLITLDIMAKLDENAQRTQLAEREGKSVDHTVVLKLFTPDAAATWLITEIDTNTGMMFGLCDLGQGFPELGYVSLDEIQSVKGHLGLPVERDRHFVGEPLSTYLS